MEITCKQLHKSLNLYKYVMIVEFIRTKPVAAARRDNRWTLAALARGEFFPENSEFLKNSIFSNFPSLFFALLKPRRSCFRPGAGSGAALGVSPCRELTMAATTEEPNPAKANGGDGIQARRFCFLLHFKEFSFKFQGLFLRIPRRKIRRK